MDRRLDVVDPFSDMNCSAAHIRQIIDRRLNGHLAAPDQFSRRLADGDAALLPRNPSKNYVFALIVSLRMPS